MTLIAWNPECGAFALIQDTDNDDDDYLRWIQPKQVLTHEHRVLVLSKIMIKIL